MSESHKVAPPVLVAGDVTIDWMLAAPPDAARSAHVSYRWDARGSVGFSASAGGAAILTALIADAFDRVDLAGMTAAKEALRNPADPAFARMYSAWSTFPRRSGEREAVWRLREFLGQQPAAAPAAPPDCHEVASPCLVLEDTNQGFRDAPAAWPTCLTSETPPTQIILKLTSPLAEGALIDHLLASHAARLTIYVSAGDLRKEYAPIGQPLSWERTARDVAKAVRAHPALTRAARVAVSLGLAGAVLVEKDGRSTLVYDPAHQEGDWEDLHPGIPYMSGTCVVAALAVAGVQQPEAPDWATALARGLVAGRAVHEAGFLVADDQGALTFPFAAASGVLSSPSPIPFRVASVPERDEWLLLEAASPSGYRTLAERVVVEGIAAAARELPVERMGAWASVDRAEIESVRSVRNITREYLYQPRKSRPLSLAVFGPPGAGKSFAIKQMAGEWSRDGVPLSILEFNLSQFAGSEALAAAFQRVRDCAVEGTLPLVFWDEFDTRREGQELGWLATFLAPMQDGAFLEGSLTRPIGPAIFVFAGGTHATMASFKSRAADVPGAKATDFLSRLRGYIDVLGPNPAGPEDQSAVLRRAFLLRPMLERRAPQLATGGRLNIDPGVLRAFLDVPTYAHGARSMESVVDMSALSGRLRYERSALPARHQLGLHVDEDTFLSLLTSDKGIGVAAV